MAKYVILDLFYKTKEWVAFRSGYIGKRAEQDKGSRCDYCGEWIDKEDDITLHHVEELTPDNVGDAMVALNPANIKQVHKSCHNKIHVHALSENKRVFIVYGPPLAGKKTYVKQRAWPGDLIIDIDMLYQAVSGLDRYNKPNPLYLNVAAIQNLLLDHVKTRYGNWDNAWIIGGYQDRYKRDRLIKQTGAEAILIDTSKEECIRRIKLDHDRRNREKEYIGYIDRWFNKHTL